MIPGTGEAAQHQRHTSVTLNVTHIKCLGSACQAPATLPILATPVDCTPEPATCLPSPEVTFLECSLQCST